MWEEGTEHTTSPAASTPSRQSRSTPGSHRRALTVNLAELLGGGWAAEGGGTTAYAAFDPERLWLPSVGNDMDAVGAGGSSHGVVVVFGFGDGPQLGLDGGVSSGHDRGTGFHGPVLEFLVSQTDFMKHLSSLPPSQKQQRYSIHRNEESEEEEGGERDGIRDVLLFTDVKVEGYDENKGLSVVHVQLKNDCHGRVNRAVVQRRAAQIIDAARALSPDSSQVTFWVDFTGILDTRNSSLQQETRYAWWDLAVASASTVSSPRVIVLVDPAAIPKLQKDADAPVNEEAGLHVDTNMNFSTVEETLWKPCGGNPSTELFQGVCVVNDDILMTLPKRPQFVDLDDDNILNNNEKDDNISCYDNDDDDELIWKRYVRTSHMSDINGNGVKILHSERFVDSDSGGNDSDSDNELVWKRYAWMLEQNSRVCSQEMPQYSSCLFLEYRGDDDSLLSSCGGDASLRELLVSWSSIDVPRPPRIIVVIVDDDSHLEDVLFSWAKVPRSENALILPIFAVSEFATSRSFGGAEESIFPSATALSSDTATAPARGRPPQPMVVDNASISCKFVRILSFAIQYFGIDVQRSACLALTKPLLQAAELVRLQAAGDYTRISSWATHSRPTESAGRRALLDVEGERERLFSELCGTNELARALRDCPRRPEVLLRLKGHMRLGIVRPVVCDAVTLVSTVPIQERARRWVDAQLSFSSQQRSRVYRYMSSFFTKDVFRASVDIVQSCSSDYFMGYQFSCVGYLQYELSSWIRRHLLVDLHIDFQPLVMENPEGAETETEPHWSRVFKRLSCTCTPRRHERLLRTETGEKKCRHLAQLLFWFLRPRPSVATSSLVKSPPPPPPSTTPNATRRRCRPRQVVPASSGTADGVTTVKRNEAAGFVPNESGATNGGHSVPSSKRVSGGRSPFDPEMSLLQVAHLLGIINGDA